MTLKSRISMVALCGSALLCVANTSSAAGVGLGATGTNHTAPGAVGTTVHGVEDTISSKNVNFGFLGSTGFSNAGHTGAISTNKAVEPRQQGGGAMRISSIGFGSTAAGAKGSNPVHPGAIGTGNSAFSVGGQGG